MALVGEHISCSIMRIRVQILVPTDKLAILGMPVTPTLGRRDKRLARNASRSQPEKKVRFRERPYLKE